MEVEFSEKAIKELCRKHGLYRTPSVNDKLYLHNIGFDEINPEVMSLYYNLRCLWLQGNSLMKIQGLEKLTELRTLYLQENGFEEIEGLETLVNLKNLNLARNFITRIEKLAPYLPELESLNLSYNNIGPDATSIEHMLQLPDLQTFDIQGNRLQDGDGVLGIVSKMSGLRVLYTQGNPFVKSFRHYRKRFIAACPNLRYLDDRPVFADERRRVSAWSKAYSDSSGDTEIANKAEREEIKAIQREKMAAQKKQMEDFEAFVSQPSHTLKLQSTSDTASIITGPKQPLTPHNLNLEDASNSMPPSPPSTSPFVDFFELD